MTAFAPTRAVALTRLADFVPDAGRNYAARRNYDYGPENRANISMLSPYARCRMLTEQEIVEAVLSRHSLSAAEKFVQEVCWRTYWKGWLERRPHVWMDYLRGVEAAQARLDENGGLRRAYDRAVSGETGVDAFDAFARELLEHGYLHNHARMWFASIWVYTLKLPWELGADHFFRHLLDGDPASNTLSWRWVCGLQTVGKTYLARADNIHKYTDGRFSVEGLAEDAPPLPFDGHPPAMAAPSAPAPLKAGPAALVITEEDLNPESLDFGAARIEAVAALDPAGLYAGHANHVRAFKSAAMSDALARAAAHFGCQAETFAVDNPAEAARWIATRGLTNAVTAHCPVGPMQSALPAVTAAMNEEGVALQTVMRPWDAAFWPHAARGFFQLKEKIPGVLERLGVAKT
jgi:deoxyribodipyrimidine photo-lyase